MVEKIPIMDDILTEGPEGITLRAYKCRICEQVHFPRPETCLNCFSDVLEGVALSRRGRLFTYTVVHMPTAHFQPPYAVGYVDLPKGLRVFSPLDILEDKPFEVGMEVEIKVGPIWQEEEKEVTGYKFTPV